MRIAAPADFRSETGKHIQDYMAIVLDDRVQGAPPVIRSQITTRGQIELGSASLQQAQDLALVLRAVDPVRQSSLYSRPGSRKWTCPSITPASARTTHTGLCGLNPSTGPQMCLSGSTPPPPMRV